MLEISPIMAKEIQDANNATLALIEIEDVFNIFIESYIAFEKAMLSAGVDFLFERRANTGLDDYFDEVWDKFNLHILTILTAFRCYDDHIPQRLVDIARYIPKIVEYAKDISCEEYDACFEYRVITKLRNFAQHSKLPLTALSFSQSNQFEPDTPISKAASRGRVTVNPQFSAISFVESAKFGAVGHEIEALRVSEIDAKHLIRTFIAAMAKRHRRLQSLVEPVVPICASHIDLAYNAVSKEAGRGVELLYLDELSGVEALRSINVAHDLVQRLMSKRNRLSSLENADRLFVSSELIFNKRAFLGITNKVFIPK